MHSFTDRIFNKAHIFRLQRSLQLAFVVIFLFAFHQLEAQPCPVATPVAPSTVCSGAITSIVLSSDQPGTTYTWTTVQTDVVGASDCTSGCGTSIVDTLTAIDVFQGSVSYTVTPFANGCFGTPIIVSITVNPIPLAIAANSTICSGATSSVAITSDVAGATFVWTVIQAGVSGASPGSGSLISQTLNTTGPSSGIATYNITPTAGGCVGEPINTKVTVRQLPAITLVSDSLLVCQGTTTADLAYSSSGGSPNQYSVNYDAAAEAQGFVDVVNQALPASPIVLVVPVGAALGVYNAVVSVNNTVNGCPGASYPITITVVAPPTISDAGLNQTPACGITSVTLAANTPIIGTGSWSIISGAGGSFVLATDPNTVFNGVAGVTYVLRWTISNPPCPPSTDDVTITFNQNPSTAAAGPNQSVCATSAILAANTPITGTGNWSIFSGAGGSFVLATDPTTTFNGVAGTTYVLVWTISNPPCTPSTDSVTIILNTTPTLVITDPVALCSPATADLTQAAVTAGSSGGLTFTYFTDAGATLVYATPTTATAGTYYIVGTAVGGCADTAAVTVTVNPKPTLITTPQSICSPAVTVDLTLPGVTAGSTPGLVFTYFTDPGATSVYGTPAAATSGTYYIVGTLGGACSDTAGVTVTVNPAPTVITNNQTVCSPATVDLTAPAVTLGSTGGLTFSYFTDAGATITYGTPAVAPAGTYYIVGVTAFGCSDTAAVTVTVNPTPTVVTVPQSACAPATINLTLPGVTAGSTPGLSFTYFTDAAATNPYLTPTLATTGTYYIVGTIGGCSDTTAVTVTINPKPDLVTNNPAAVCEPATVDLTLPAVTAGSTAGLTFTYFTDAGATISYATPSTATSGTYYIVGTTLAGCSDTASVIVTIIPKPVVVTVPQTACSPATVNLTLAGVTAGSTGGLSFTYFTDAGATSPYGTPTAATTGTYFIVGSTVGGCSDTTAVTVTINPSPTVVTNDPAPVCSPATVDLTAPAVTAGSTGGLVFTYFLDAGATMPHGSPAATSASGTYYIVGTIGGCSDTTAVTVTINPQPSVITVPLSLCLDVSANLTADSVTTGSAPLPLVFTYFSDPGATIIVPDPTAVGAGTYYIVGTIAATGCADTTSVDVTLAPIVLTTDQSACSPTTTTDLTAASVTAGSTPGLTYTYFTDAGATISYGTPATATAGTYYIVGTTPDGCADTTAVTFTVNPKPTVTTVPQTVCAPATVDLTAAAVTAGSTAGLSYSYFTNAAATIVYGTPATAGAGTYYIVGSTVFGCTDTASVLVTIDPQPIVSTVNQAVCSPASTTDLTLPAVTAGSTPGLTYTYFTNAGATISYATPTVATAGTYYIVGTLGAGCADTTAVIFTVNPKPTVVTVPQSICAPATINITLPAVTAGSTGGLTFTYFTDAGATISFGTPTTAGSGTYYIVGSTGPGCSDTTAVVVTIDPKPNLVTVPQTVCSPATTVDLTLPGVTAGSTGGLSYTYFTDPGATSPYGTPTLATTGTYYIVGETLAGCSDTASVVVTINPKPSVITVPQTICNPATTVDITLPAATAGSTAGLSYTYFTDAGATSTFATPTVATAGTYYIVGVVPATGCADTTGITVTVNTKPTVITNDPAPICSPATVDLTLPAVTLGSTGGLTFSYFTDAGATVVYATPGTAVAGTYYIVGVTVAGCSDTAAVNVVSDAIPTVVTVAQTICSPSSSVDLTAPGVTAGSTPGLTYTYFTDAGATISYGTPAVATAGTYYIVGSTAGGCADTASVVVTINPKPTVITVPQSICTPATTVDLTLAAVTAGSTAGLTYSYFTDAGATASYATPATAVAGTYYIVGLTLAGCSDTTAVTVTVNPKPTVVTVPQSTCSSPTVDLTQAGVTAGSTAGLTYTYFTDAGATASYATPTVATAGTYYIVGATLAGCSDTTAVTVTINPKPTVVTVPQSICSPATTVDLTLAGVTTGSTAGLSYTYFTDAGATASYATPTVATAGTYYIVGATLAGCSDTTAVTVTVNPKPTVVTVPQSICSPATTVDITLAGVTAGSTAGLTYTYFTDAGATVSYATPTTAVAGTYYLVGSTVAGCSDTAGVTVTVNPKPTVVTVAQAACSPATIDLTLAAVTAGSTGGLTYSYFTDAGATASYATPTVATAGTYFIVGVTVAGCSDTTAVTVTINTTPTVVTNAPAAVCSPATVDLTLAAVTAGSTAGLTYTYFTDAGATAVYATPATAIAGTYFIVGSAVGGCSDTTAVTVVIDPKPTVVTVSQALCLSATVDLTAPGITTGSTPGLTFTYFTDAGATTSYLTPTTAGSGTYYIVGVTPAGCSDTTSVDVTVNVIVVTVPQAACSPATVDLTLPGVTTGSSGGLTFSYFTDAGATVSYATPTVATAGTYYIVGVEGGGCSDTTAVTVTINPTPIVVTNNPAAVCSPATADLTLPAVTAGSTGGLTFTYFTDAGATVVYPTPATATAGTYYIVGTTVAGCSDTTAVTVTVDPKPTVLTVNPAAVCAPATVDLTLAAVTAGSTAGLTYTYFTDAGATLSYATPATASAGIYYIVGATLAGCSDTTAVTVTVNPKPDVITVPQAACSPATVDLTLAGVTAGSTAGLTYTYFTDAGATLSYATPAIATAGTYYIVGVTLAGCSDTTAVVVTINPKPTVVTVNPAAVCSPATVDLTLAAVTAGSTAGLTYTYFTDAGASVSYATPTTSTAGTYYIVGVTLAGCSDTTAVTVTVNPKPDVITVPQAACSPATVDLTLAGVTAGSTAGLTYTYFTDAGATVSYATPATATAGTYYIVGVTVAGCSDTAAVVVTINPKPTVVTVPQAACSPATIDLTAAGVTLGSTAGLTFTYFTDAGATISYATPTTAVAGTYYIVGVTLAGCSDTTAVTVTIDPKPTVITDNPATVCSPATVDLTLAAVTAGSTAGLTFTYFTDAGATVSYATPATSIAGTYYIVGVTLAGCSDTTSVIVTIDSLPVVVTVSQVLCLPSTTADLTVAGVTAGSTAGLTFTYFTDAGATVSYATPTVAVAGTYYIVGVTVAGCADTTAVIVTVNPKPTVVTNDPTAVCSPATIDITTAAVTAGSTAGLTFTYFTDAGATLSYATPTTAIAGVYYIVGVTLAGCSDTTAVTVTVNPTPTVITVPQAVCSPASTVDLTLAGVTVGSTAGLTYTYFTDAGATVVYATPATAVAGTYYIVGETLAGCSDTTAVTFTVNPKPTVITNNPAAVCSPATVDLTLAAVTAGSTAGLTFTYFTDAGATVAYATPAAAIAGIYYIVGVTLAGCSDTSAVTVTVNSTPTVTATGINLTCFNVCNGSVIATIAGGSPLYTYTWSTGVIDTIAAATDTITGLCIGGYTVTVTDANGCSGTDSVTITQPTQLVPNITTGNVSCYNVCDGASESSPSGGTAPYTFSWNTGSVDSLITGLCPGTYTVIVTDSFGCTSTLPDTIVQAAAVLSNAVITNATCGLCDGQVVLSPSGGIAPYSFLWGSGQTSDTESNLCSGLYSVNITDSAGCSSSYSIPISNPGGPASAAITSANISCFGLCDGTVTAVTPVGGTPPYSFLWIQGGEITPTLSNLCAGVYYVQIADSAGCSLVDSVIITEPTPVVVNQFITAATCGVCDGGLSVTPSGGAAPYTLLWSTGSASDTLTGLCPGFYSVQITDSLGCSQDIVMPLNSQNAPTLTTSSVPLLCNAACNATATVVAAGGILPYTYLWNDPGAQTTDVATALCAGTYFVQVTGGGCVSFASVSITDPAPIGFAFANAIDPLCNGNINGSIAVIPFGGTLPYTFSWTGSGSVSDTASGLSAGVYIVTVTDANGCTSSQTNTLVDPDSLTISNVPTPASCNTVADGAIDVTVSGGSPGFTYQWSGGSSLTTQDLTNILTGSYTITVTDTNGCSITDNIIVTSTVTVLGVAGNDTALCEPDSMLLSAVGSSANVINYQWFQLPANTLVGSVMDVSVLPPVGVTDYYVLVDNGAGCSHSDTITVTVNPLPVADAGADVTILATVTTVIGGNPTGPAGATYLWDPILGLDNATNANPVANPLVTTTYTVTVTSAEGCTSSDVVIVTVVANITFANGISPNSDGANDEWIIDNIELFPNSVVEIYNRWGELLFQSVGYTEKWKGMFKGQPLPIGTYYYIINLNDPLFPDAFTGPITILR